MKGRAEARKGRIHPHEKHSSKSFNLFTIFSSQEVLVNGLLQLTDAQRTSAATLQTSLLILIWRIRSNI